MLLPRDYELDADNWRKYQYETVQWIGNTRRDEDDNYAVKLNEAPTGSGKSMTALAAGHRYRQTVVLTAKRALQSQYESSYRGCTVLFGRNNYPCVHEDNPPGIEITAQDCRYERPRKECDFVGSCPYHIQKENAHDAHRAVLNYAYWLTTYRNWSPDFLVLDEAHNVPDMVLSHVGTNINEHQRQTWFLPDFPLVDSAVISGLFKPKDYTPPSVVAAEWLQDCANILLQKSKTMQGKIERGNTSQHLFFQKRAADNLLSRVSACYTALTTTPGDHWFIRSGPGVDYYQGQLVPGFICKPLTARYDYNRFFSTLPERAVLIMSATIGDPAVYCNELGITDYDFYRTPAVWPPATRPVHILDVPSVGYAKTQKDPTIWDKQADTIAKAIKNLPPHWSGIILVSRKSEATLLANRLRKRGLADRMWVPPGADAGDYKPTNEQLVAWNEQLAYRSNSIAVAWSFWEGVDAKDCQILICAKVPFHQMSDEYEMARQRYDHAFSYQRIAWMLEQGLGRVRRGNPQDYDTNGIVRKYVAIADGSWPRIKKYLSQSMQESLVMG